jgi:hypothetical protein
LAGEEGRASLMAHDVLALEEVIYRVAVVANEQEDRPLSVES